MNYGFHARFIAPILAGTKVGTLRNHRLGRSRHARVGDVLGLVAGSRYRPRRFFETRCTGLWRICLVMTAVPRISIREAREDSQWTTGLDLDSFARGDGFADWDELARYWRDVHKTDTFQGAWICWHGADGRAVA